MPVQPLRAAVVDNSATVRSMLRSGLERRGIEVVAEGADGRQAVDLCVSERPDVLSLDLMMPGMDGEDALRELRQRRIPVPVVVVSSMVGDGSERALRLLELGAVDVVLKPLPGAPFDGFLDTYADKLRLAAEVHIEVLWADAPSPRSTRHRPGPASERRLVIIAASTGGPRALHCIAQTLPSRLGCGMLVVQHMPAAFTSQFARRLGQVSSLGFREAGMRDTIHPEGALVAPGGVQLRVLGRTRVACDDHTPVGGLCPRADVTILDAVEHFGKRVLLVVLTGMGRDGLEGARAVRRAGGTVIVESRETALIDGMPGSVADAGLADEVVALPLIADAICRSAG